VIIVAFGKLIEVFKKYCWDRISDGLDAPPASSHLNRSGQNWPGNRGGNTMDELHIIGVDLAKHIFQVHGSDKSGRVLFRKKLSRPQFSKFLTGVMDVYNNRC